MGAPLDRGWSWVISLAVLFNNAIMIGLVNVSGMIYNEMISLFDTSASMVSFIIGFRAAVFSIFAVVGLGILNEFLHSRLIVIAGGLSACIGFTVCIFATKVEHLFAYAILAGAGHSLIYGPGLVMVGKYFKTRRSFGNGLAVSGTSIGTLIFPFLMKFLLEQYNFLGAMMICGAICLNCCMAGLLLRPTEFYNRCADDESSSPSSGEPSGNSTPQASNANSTTNVTEGANSSITRRAVNENVDGKNTSAILVSYKVMGDNKDNNGAYQKRTSEQEIVIDCLDIQNKSKVDHNEIQIGEDEQPHDIQPYNFFFSRSKGNRKKKIIDMSLMKKPLFVMFQIASALYMVSITIQAIFLPAFCQQDGRNLSEVTILLSILGVTDFVGRLTFGFLGDLEIIDRKLIFITASTLIGILACTLQYFAGFWWLLAYHCIYGFLSAAYPTLMPVTIVDLFGLDNMSRSLSTTLLLKGVIQIGLSPALGYIKDTTGSYALSFTLIGALTLTASLIFVIVVIPLIRRNDRLAAKETTGDNVTNEIPDSTDIYTTATEKIDHKRV